MQKRRVDNSICLYQKYNKYPFTKEQVLQVINILENFPSRHAQDISEEVGGEVSARQVKKIRFIMKKGSEQHLEDVKSLDWRFSSIVRDIKRLIKIEKDREKRELKNNKE